MHGHDINKFPKQPGLILFPISISRIQNAQSAQKCFEHLEYLVEEKIIKPWVGTCFIYGDNLYLYSDEPASVLKNKHQTEINAHKNAFQKILDKNPWYIQHAMTYMTWGQLLLESRDYMDYFAKFKTMYETDQSLQQAVAEDFSEFTWKVMTKNHVDFFLEEALIFYLISKGKLQLPNRFVLGHEKWTLQCYPGPALATEKWLYRNNPFKLSNPENKYENFVYDLEKRMLIDLTR